MEIIFEKSLQMYYFDFITASYVSYMAPRNETTHLLNLYTVIKYTSDVGRDRVKLRGANVPKQFSVFLIRACTWIQLF